MKAIVFNVGRSRAAGVDAAFPKFPLFSIPLGRPARIGVAYRGFFQRRKPAACQNRTSLKNAICNDTVEMSSAFCCVHCSIIRIG
jgi:hypothetical protein